MTAKSFLRKLFAAHHYKPVNKINAEVLLFKPTENYAKLSNDYGLSEVSLMSHSSLSTSFVINFSLFSFSSATAQ